MRARPFLASYTSPSGTRKVPIQFFAASPKDALRVAKKKAGKGLLFGLTLTRVEPCLDTGLREQGKQAA